MMMFCLAHHHQKSHIVGSRWCGFSFLPATRKMETGGRVVGFGTSKGGACCLFAGAGCRGWLSGLFVGAGCMGRKHPRPPPPGAAPSPTPRRSPQPPPSRRSPRRRTEPAPLRCGGLRRVGVGWGLFCAGGWGWGLFCAGGRLAGVLTDVTGLFTDVNLVFTDVTGLSGGVYICIGWLPGLVAPVRYYGGFPPSLVACPGWWSVPVFTFVSAGCQVFMLGFVFPSCRRATGSRGFRGFRS